MLSVPLPARFRPCATFAPLSLHFPLRLLSTFALACERHLPRLEQPPHRQDPCQPQPAAASGCLSCIPRDGPASGCLSCIPGDGALANDSAGGWQEKPCPGVRAAPAPKGSSLRNTRTPHRSTALSHPSPRECQSHASLPCDIEQLQGAMPRLGNLPWQCRLCSLAAPAVHHHVWGGPVQLRELSQNGFSPPGQAFIGSLQLSKRLKCNHPCLSPRPLVRIHRELPLLGAMPRLSDSAMAMPPLHPALTVRLGVARGTAAPRPGQCRFEPFPAREPMLYGFTDHSLP